MNKKISILSFVFILMIAFTSQLSALSYSVNRNFLSYNLIYASGKIRRGDLYKLKRTYRKLSRDRQTIVVFNSAGGELNEGLRIGEFLTSNNIGSAVKKNGMCASSCALAFLGGRSKDNSKLLILPYSSKLGFHSFYYRNSNYVKTTTVQRDLANVLNYASYVDAPTSLMAEMFNTKSSNMHWVNSNDRTILNLKTDLVKRRVSFSNHTKSKYHKRERKKHKRTMPAIQEPVTQITHSMTQSGYIKNYIGQINSIITADRGRVFNNSIALNDSSYQSWLSSHIRYMYLKKTKLLSRNKIEAEVVYALTNGKRICSKNRYSLLQSNSGWKILSKSHRACNHRSRKTINKIGRSLP